MHLKKIPTGDGLRQSSLEPFYALFSAVVTVDREAATSARFSVPTRLAQRGRWRVVVSSGSEATTVSAVQGQQASVVEGLSPNTVYTAQIFGANGESSTLAPFLTRPFMGEATGNFHSIVPGLNKD